MSSEHRPTDEQLRDWLEEGGFPAYFTDEHGQYLDAMFTELLELRALLAANHRAYLTAIGVTEENPNV